MLNLATGNADDPATNITFSSLSADEATYLEDNGYYKMTIFNTQINKPLYLNVSDDKAHCY